MAKTKEIEAANQNDIQINSAMNPQILIEKAVEKGLDVTALEKLIAIRKELKAEAAEEEFNRALSMFQSECPDIEKTKKVMAKDNKTIRYQYAPLDSIVKQVKPMLKKHGFSYTIKSRQGEGWVKVVCQVRHVAGHNEETELIVPVDDGYMNNIQKIGSANTYAKRYAFCNAFGIMTADEDDDGNGTGEQVNNKKNYTKRGKANNSKNNENNNQQEEQEQSKKAQETYLKIQILVKSEYPDKTKIFTAKQIKAITLKSQKHYYDEKVLLELLEDTKIYIENHLEDYDKQKEKAVIVADDKQPTYEEDLLKRISESALNSKEKENHYKKIESIQTETGRAKYHKLIEDRLKEIKVNPALINQDDAEEPEEQIVEDVPEQEKAASSEKVEDAEALELF
jgi:hypothetical protein